MSDLDNYYKLYYHENKARINFQRRKKYWETVGRSPDQRPLVGFGKSYTREYRLLYAAKRRAQLQGLPFDLTLEDIVIPEKCPVFGFKFCLDGSDKSKQTTPSMDRIIPEKGYVRGNIAIISLKANRMKQDLTREIILKLLDYIDSHHNQTETKQSLKIFDKEVKRTLDSLPISDLPGDPTLYESDLYKDWANSVIEGLDSKDQD